MSYNQKGRGISRRADEREIIGKNKKIEGRRGQGDKPRQRLLVLLLEGKRMQKTLFRGNSREFKWILRLDLAIKKR